MSEKKLLKVVNEASDLGRWLMETGRSFMILGAVAFGVALVADQILQRLERADYAEDDLC